MRLFSQSSGFNIEPGINVQVSHKTFPNYRRVVNVLRELRTGTPVTVTVAKVNEGGADDIEEQSG